MISQRKFRYNYLASFLITCTAIAGSLEVLVVSSFSIPHQSRRRFSSALSASSKKEDSNSSTTVNWSKSTRNKRKPAFPIEAYPLAKDEGDLKYNFISFIDQSFLASYSQSVRLVEPRLYAKPDQFRKENANTPPTIEDVAEPQSCTYSTCMRECVFVCSFVCYFSCTLLHLSFDCRSIPQRLQLTDPPPSS